MQQSTSISDPTGRLDCLGHHKRPAVVPAQKHIRFVAGLAREPLAVAVKRQHRADGHRILVQVDLVGLQMLG